MAKAVRIGLARRTPCVEGGRTTTSVFAFTDDGQRLVVQVAAGPNDAVRFEIHSERQGRSQLLRLDEVLHERVIGQDEAVGLVADAVIRARASVKTELSRAPAEALFDSEDKEPERRAHRAPSATHREESAHDA